MPGRMAKRFVIFSELNMLRRANVQDLIHSGFKLFRQNYITTGQNKSMGIVDSKELAVEAVKGVCVVVPASLLCDTCRKECFSRIYGHHPGYCISAVRRSFKGQHQSSQSAHFLCEPDQSRCILCIYIQPRLLVS